MSLVADYSDSVSEEDEEEGSSNRDKSQVLLTISNSSLSANTIVTSNTSLDCRDEEAATLAGRSSKTFFDSKQSSEDDSGSDSSSSDEDDSSKKRKRKHEGSQGRKGTSFVQGNNTILENPFRYFGSGNVSAEDSVLRVEFREQAAQKTALMERHVKMSETDGAAEKINGKTICWQYRKGKCRFGHNCKFAHDSDISNSLGESAPKNFETTEKAVCVNNDNQAPASMVTYTSSAHLSGERERKTSASISDDEDELRDKMKKKRPGLSASLNPGKKVMKMYFKGKSNQ